jgi:hypothetical protein
MIKTANSAGDFKGNSNVVTVESVVGILEREIQSIIQEWLIRAEKESDLMSVPMNREDRGLSLR